jgi:UDP-N-acetylmuramate dehydrogenase
LRIHLLGGGSNTLFADHGFDGLVVAVDVRGRNETTDGDRVLLTCGAGEPWDEVVDYCVGRGYAGVECLSGIPGSVGATPIQNVGAYGQSVHETIDAVHLLDREALTVTELPGEQCAFRYRWSRFKGTDAERYVVTAVRFRLRPGGPPAVRYPELERALASPESAAPVRDNASALRKVRDAVIALRRQKGMVVDPQDPESRSVGSFFLNPVLPAAEVDTIESRWRASGGTSGPPRFPADDGVKISAAWLVEHAGFGKGLSRGRTRVSRRHALALVNDGGTTAEVLALAEEIREAVHARFGVRLQPEPVIVP